MAIYQQLTDPSIHRSHAAFSLGLLAKTGDYTQNLDCCEIADTHAATILGVHHTWSSIPLL
jgi:hypothetical protein